MHTKLNYCIHLTVCFVQDNFKTDAFLNLDFLIPFIIEKKRTPVVINCFHFLVHLIKLKAEVNFSDRLLSVASVHLSVCVSVGKHFTFSFSSPEPSGQIQSNIAQSLLE